MFSTPHKRTVILRHGKLPRSPTLPEASLRLLPEASLRLLPEASLRLLPEASLRLLPEASLRFLPTMPCRDELLSSPVEVVMSIDTIGTEIDTSSAVNCFLKKGEDMIPL